MDVNADCNFRGSINDYTLELRSSPPINPASGQMYLNLNDGTAYIYNGGYWASVSYDSMGTAGYTVAGGSSVAIDKLMFANDTNAALASVVSAEIYRGAGFSNAVAGYVKDTSKTEKLLFVNDSCNSINSGVSDGRRNMAGCQSSVAGYTMGGLIGSGSSPWNSNIDKMMFSNDSNSSIATQSPGTYGNSCVNSSLAGYSLAGSIYYNTYTSLIYKVTFSTDTAGSISASMNGHCCYHASYNSKDNGYAATGITNTDAIVNTITKISFASETSSTISSVTGVTRFAPAGYNSLLAGYISGGYSPSPSTLLNIINKMLFSNEANSSLSTTLGAARQGPTGFELI